MNPNQLSATVILSIPNVELYQTKDKKPSLVTRGQLVILYLPSHNCFILQVNNFNYHLSKELPFVACIEKNPASFSSYVFPNVDGYYILKIIEVKTPESLSSLEKIFANHCTLSYHEQSVEEKFGITTEKANKTKTEIATDIIYKGGEITKTGLIKGAEVLSKGISKLGDFVKEKYIKPSPDSQVQVNESTVQKMEIANVTTGAVHTFTKAQADGIITVGKVIGQEVGRKLQKTDAGQKFEKYEHHGTVMAVGKSTVHVVASLFVGMTEALSIIGRGIGDTTTKIVQHKYGDNAGKATEKGVNTVGNVWNITKEIPRQIATAIEKGTAKKVDTPNQKQI